MKLFLKNHYSLIFSLLLLCIVSIFFIQKNFLWNDEVLHIEQIRSIYSGVYIHNQFITNILGYHFSIAFISKLFSVDNYHFFRLINYVFSLFTIIFFYLALTKTEPNQKIIKTIELMTLPVLTILFFIVYTDVFALFWMSLCLFFYSKKKYALSIFFLSIAILVRQTYIVYVICFYFIFLYDLLKDNQLNFFQILKKEKILHLLLFVTCSSFLAFVYINNGVAMGDKTNHQIAHFRPANIYFCFNLFFYFNLVSIIFSYKSLFHFCKQNKYFIFILFIIYIYLVNKTYIIDHVFNERWTMDGFIRMKFLYYYLDSLIGKIVLIITSFISIIYIFSLQKIQPILLILFSFTILYLVPLWLVEQRYYLPFFFLFIYFKPENKHSASFFQIPINILINGYLLYNIYLTKFFL